MEQGRKNIVRITKTTTLIVVVINLSSISACLGAPLAYDPRLEIKPPSWQEDNTLEPMITEPCSPNGCWAWLPSLPVNRGNEEILREDSNAKLESQRVNGEIESTLDSWKTDSGTFGPRARSSPSSFVRQISPRPVKKDVFTSRSWGPGGLPFSVLYMNPHGPRNNNNRSSAGTSEIAPTKPMPEPTIRRIYEGVQSTTSSTKHQQNNRVTIRNGSTGQPRRQYSIIPQLFISYGWGPLGK